MPFAIEAVFDFVADRVDSAVRDDYANPARGFEVESVRRHPARFCRPLGPLVEQLGKAALDGRVVVNVVNVYSADIRFRSGGGNRNALVPALRLAALDLSLRRNHRLFAVVPVEKMADATEHEGRRCSAARPTHIQHLVWGGEPSRSDSPQRWPLRINKPLAPASWSKHQSKKQDGKFSHCRILYRYLRKAK